MSRVWSADHSRATGEFRRGLAVQFRVIGALLMREVQTRYGRENIGFLWIIGEPIIFTFGVVALWTLIPSGGRSGHGVPLVSFIVTGYVPLLLFRHIMSRAVVGLRSNSTLLYHRIVTPLDIHLSRFILEIAGSVLAFVLACTLFVCLGMMNPPQDIHLLLMGWFYAIWFCTSLGLIVGALSDVSELTERLYTPFSYLMIPISGAFIMPAWLPADFRELLLYFPPANYAEMIRGGYLGASVQVFYHTWYLTKFCLVLTVIGLGIQPFTRKYIVHT